MSFKATLLVGGNEIDLNYYYLDINQDIDSRGRPSSIPKGGKITAEFESLGNDDFIANWAADPVKAMGGSIQFRGISASSVQKEIVFKDGVCVEFSEKFDSTSSSSMTTVITITSPEVKIDGGNHKNYWDSQYKGAS